MEISGSLHSTWLPSPTNNRGAPEQRGDEKETRAERATEPSSLREYISRGDVVQEQGRADYREALDRIRQGVDNRVTEKTTGTVPSSRMAQQALAAYQSNINTVDNGGVELLPRVDGYA